MTAKKKGATPKELRVTKESIRRQGQLDDKEADQAAGGGAVLCTQGPSTCAPPRLR
jgi:hypothetical protein